MDKKQLQNNIAGFQTSNEEDGRNSKISIRKGVTGIE